MASPPTSPPCSNIQSSTNPSLDLGGASRVTGGILRGRALGNVFNHADADELLRFNLAPRKGRVQVYMSRVDPTVTKPDMSLKHEVTPRLKPILKALARGYSPIRSTPFVNYLKTLLLIVVLDHNQRVFVYEDDVWTMKGRYETALEDDEDAVWTYESSQDILRLFIVSNL